jgi:uncharacterized protein YkwD
MARIRILIAALVAICAIAVTASSAAAMSPEKLMLHKVNHYRHSHGLPSVHRSKSLTGSAERKADSMMSRGYFGHDSRIHASSHYHYLGEILEVQRGTKPGVSLAFHTWLNSSPHRAIILDRGFNYAGVGRATGTYRGHKSTMWVMHFGHP